MNLPEPNLKVLPDVNDEGRSITLCSGSTIVARITPRTKAERVNDEAFFERLASTYTIPADPAEIEEARQIHASDEINIDDNAGISHADGGFWVQAWVWVEDKE